MNLYLTYQAAWSEARGWIAKVQEQGERMLRLGQQMIFIREQLRSDEEVWAWVKAHCPQVWKHGRERLQDAWDYARECAEERSFAA